MAKKPATTYPVLYVPHISGLYGLFYRSSAHQKTFAKIFALNIAGAFEECTWFVKDEIKSQIFKDEKDFLKRHFGTYKAPDGVFWMLSTTSLELRQNPQVIAYLKKRFPGKVKVADVPVGNKVYVFEYDDGSESVHEEHKFWR